MQTRMNHNEKYALTNYSYLLRSLVVKEPTSDEDNVIKKFTNKSSREKIGLMSLRKIFLYDSNNNNKPVTDGDHVSSLNGNNNGTNLIVERVQRLMVFFGCFLTIVAVLVLMSKIYKAVNTLKTRYKSYGYYINPKCESILMNLNRQIRSKSLTLASNLNKKMSTSAAGELEKEVTQATTTTTTTTGTSGEKIYQNCHVMNEKMKQLRITQMDCGHINEIFELDEEANKESASDEMQVDEEGENQTDEDEEECEETSAKSGSFKLRKNFLYRMISNDSRVNYRRLNVKSSLSTSSANSSASSSSCKSPSRTRLFRIRKNAYSICSSLLSHRHHLHQHRSWPKKRDKKQKAARPTSASLTDMDSSTSRASAVSFKLPVILVTDTSSMNTIIIDPYENDF